MIAAALITALLLTAGIPETTLGEPGEQTTVTAGRGEFSRPDGKAHVEGGAVVNSGGVWLRADKVDFDVGTKALSAEGNLVIIDGNVVVTGDAGQMALGNPDTLQVSGAELYQKEKPLTAEALDRLSASKKETDAADGAVQPAQQVQQHSEQAQAGDGAQAADTSKAADADADGEGGSAAETSAAAAETTDAAESSDGSDAQAADEHFGLPEESPEVRRSFERSEALAAESRETFARTGKNALVIRASEIRRTDGAYEARDLRLTSCDCQNADCPDWSLGARSAEVRPGDGAWLYWPTFRIHDVPVLGFPILYVPLSPRRTGFLFPKIEFSSSGGFGFDLPFFLTLGRSFDLTFTAGFLTKPLLALSSQAVQRESAWGPRGAVEFRYAPHRSTRGSIKFAGILDRGSDIVTSSSGEETESHIRGFRGQLTARHRSSFDNGLGVYADVVGLSDARYLSDVSSNLLAGATTYLSSSARAFWRQNDFELTLSTQWFQDLATARSNFFPDSAPLIGASSPAAFQRPAVFLAQMPLKRIAGPLHFGGELSLIHARPLGLGGALTQERLLASIRRTDAADFYALTRIDLAPKFWLPFRIVGPLRGELTLGARGDFSAYTAVLKDGTTFGSDSANDVWGRAFADFRLWTELSRTFGTGDSALRHAIVPSVTLRGSTREFGNRDDFGLSESIAEETAIIPLDELDASNRAASPRLFQGIAAVRSRLSRLSGTGALTVTLGQGYDFTRLAWGETFADLSTSFRWVSAGAGVRFDPELKELSMVQGHLRLSDPRGDYFSATYDLLRGSGTSLMRQGLDDLLGAQADPSLTSQFQQINLGVGITIVPQFALSYGIRIAPTADKGDKILLHSAALRFRGRCDCWSVDLGGQWAPVTERWSATFLVTLKNLGSFGNGG